MGETETKSGKLLQVEDLKVTYPGSRGAVAAVDGVDFELDCERLGVVGESGSGKSTLGRAILRLVQTPGRVQAKRLGFRGQNLLSLTERQMQRIRGRDMTMILQDPKYSLNPVMSVGEQIGETYRAHFKVGRREAWRMAVRMLEDVHIRDPERVADSYPHQLSGGMGQRVMIAMMLITSPSLLIADEPTSALDVPVRAQILSILDELVLSRGMGLILISHDIHMIASFCDRVLVMYNGKVVDQCLASELVNSQHPYTRGLLACRPNLIEKVRRLPVLDRSRLGAA